MKTIYVALVFITMFILYGCKKDIDEPGQLTIVEGVVTDYYSNEPLKGFKMLFENRPSEFCIPMTPCDRPVYDTLITDEKGYYCYKFYNDSGRSYFIGTIIDSIYVTVAGKVIDEGKTNELNFAIKPFRKLELTVINKTKQYNYAYFNSMQTNFSEKIELYGFDIEQKVYINVAPDDRNFIDIMLSTYNDSLQEVGFKKDGLEFYLSNRDTAIIYEF